MILDMIMSLFNFVADLFMGLLSFPIFPPELADILAVVFQWMNAGLGILNFFCPLDAIAPAVAFFIAVYTIQKVYHFVMWILVKIPVLGISKK